MGGEKEDGLGLSLSLGMSCPQNNLKNNDFISSSTPPFLLPFLHNHQISAGKSDKRLQLFVFFFFHLVREGETYGNDIKLFVCDLLITGPNRME